MGPRAGWKPALPAFDPGWGGAEAPQRSFPSAVANKGLTFADPKTDFIFKRIFGSEPHKHLLIQLLNVLLELPKYDAGPHPTELVDKWALFFRDAENLDVIPPGLDEDPFREAFEIARIAQLSEGEYELYEKQKMKEQDERGMLLKAREEGEAEGRRQEAEARETGGANLATRDGSVVSPTPGSPAR